MRYLTAACPEIRRILLVESASRRYMEAAIPRLRLVFGEHVAFDLVTCLAGAPTALEPEATIWRTQDYVTSTERVALVREIAAKGATVTAILCANEPIMLRWKWWLAWKLPAKVLIVNENADCFWLDTANLRMLRRFALVRMGVHGGRGQAALRLAMLPGILFYLLIYTAAMHTKRAVRVTFFRQHLEKL